MANVSYLNIQQTNPFSSVPSKFHIFISPMKVINRQIFMREASEILAGIKMI